MSSRVRALVLSTLTAGLVTLFAAPAGAIGIDVAGIVLELPVL
ncbi:hypothetical protein WJ438_40560 [Streptomyces sp. GD-15H]